MVCESYEVTWMALEGDCRKGCKWLLCVCLAWRADGQNPPRGHWSKALVEHTLSRGTVMLFPAQREREPQFSSAWCIPGLLTICHYVQRGYRGKESDFSLFKPERDWSPSYFPPFIIKWLPTTSFYRRKSKQKQSMTMVWVWVKPTGQIFISLLSKTSVFSRKQDLKDRIIFFWRMRHEVHGPWFLRFLEGRPLNNQVKEMTCSACTVLAF